MGSNTKAGVCGTCQQRLDECNGHFGHISLALPVFHAGFLRHTHQVVACSTRHTEPFEDMLETWLFVPATVLFLPNFACLMMFKQTFMVPLVYQFINPPGASKHLQVLCSTPPSG